MNTWLRTTVSSATSRPSWPGEDDVGPIVLRLGAIVLAAGSGSRFSSRPGEKLLAPLEEDTVLGHVLRALRDFRPAVTVVVLGHGAERIVEVIDWEDEAIVRNDRPDRGVSTSLQLGIDAISSLDEKLGGVFVVLGDQPRLQASTLRELATAAERSEGGAQPIVVPRYSDDPGPRNPVLLLRPGWELVREMRGDHGLAPLIALRPELVLDVPVPGEMPDIDRPEDLEQIRRSPEGP
jgi:CTP:molybdopterin cytidylyltransferase MocA